MTKWDLTQECKVGLTPNNQYNMQIFPIIHSSYKVTNNMN